MGERRRTCDGRTEERELRDRGEHPHVPVPPEQNPDRARARQPRAEIKAAKNAHTRMRKIAHAKSSATRRRTCSARPEQAHTFPKRVRAGVDTSASAALRLAAKFRLNPHQSGLAEALEQQCTTPQRRGGGSKGKSQRPHAQLPSHVPHAGPGTQLGTARGRDSRGGTHQGEATWVGYDVRGLEQDGHDGREAAREEEEEHAPAGVAAPARAQRAVHVRGLLERGPPAAAQGGEGGGASEGSSARVLG